jgi:hypothetical protein
MSFALIRIRVFATQVNSFLEYGYSSKGSDLNVTMGRQEIVKVQLPTSDVEANCPDTPLMTNFDSLEQRTTPSPGS